MARQQQDTTEDAFILEVPLLGSEADRVWIEQLGIDKRIKINTEKWRIDKGTLDRFDAEQNVFSCDRTAVLKARIFPDLKRVDQLIRRDLRTRLGDIRFDFQGSWISRQ